MTETSAAKGGLAEAKAGYTRLLEGAMPTSDFYAQIISLALAYPYFFGPYLEMIDYLEARELYSERLSLIRFTVQKIKEFLASGDLVAEARAAWTQKEAQILLDILKRAGVAGRTGLRSALLRTQVNLFHSSVPTGPTPSFRHLVSMDQGIDVLKLQEEIAENEIAWSYDTSRQDIVSHHKDTNAIVLRRLESREGAFIEIDGPHESKRTPFAEVFPHTMKVIEDFAAKERGGLGRIALVRLKPHSTVYRHFDSEPWLQGRNRYHLVIRSENGSYMTSGSETKLFKEGELFLFDNKVMHTAENRSSDWRIHAIFDMRVPSQVRSSN
jgi:hypothetical protein